MSNYTFKHSGTLGDLIYSLPIVKHFGGGKFYLHLHQVDWIGQHYYGAKPNPFHQGRMNAHDYEFMKSFMRAQDYIEDFLPLDPKATEITHNLDKFRPLFVGHPGNYVDIYSHAFGIADLELRTHLRQTSWLNTPKSREVNGRDICINRTTRWVPAELNPLWEEWKGSGFENRAFFIGLPEEYTAFKNTTGWDIPYQKTSTLLEVAEYIDGAEVFVGNQSMALALAIGLGKDDIWCEARRDLPIERNECYFPMQQGVHYF